jgi:hypothetical protein
MQEILRFGCHTVEFGEDEIAVLTYRGTVSAQEMRDMLALEDARSSNAAYALTICDVREFGGMDGPTRKISADHPRRCPMFFTAYVGASFSLRVVIAMYEKAVNLLHGEKYASAFFDNHAAARAWLLAKRATMRGE